MKTGRPARNAVIIFTPDAEEEARSFVRENLQYRELYHNFYMLPVPPAGSTVEPTLESLEKLKVKGEISYSYREDDCFLIHKKAALDRSASHPSYNKAVLKFANKFKQYNIILIYYYLEEEKPAANEPMKLVRAHMRYTSSLGDKISQVPIHRPKRMSAQQVFDWGFFNFGSANEDPPYHYLILENLASVVTDKSTDNTFDRSAYGKAIGKAIAFRQAQVEPFLRYAEYHYPNPKTIEEKIGNLFDAYASSGLLAAWRPHKDLATDIASDLYELKKESKEENGEESSESSESSDELLDPPIRFKECLTIIKDSIETNPEHLHARQIFQGLLREVINMGQNGSYLLVGRTLHETYDDKCKKLEELKKTLNNDATSSCIDKILLSIRELEKQDKPLTVLLKALESSIDVIQRPSADSYQKQYRVAKELGQHSWGRILGGLLLCLLGISLGIGIGLAIYFSAGIAGLVGAPILIQGITLSATLINAGAAVLAGIVAAAAPMTGSGICLFGKDPIQKNMEQLANTCVPTP